MTMKARGGTREKTEKLGSGSSLTMSIIQLLQSSTLPAFFPLSRHGYAEVQC